MERLTGRKILLLSNNDELIRYVRLELKNNIIIVTASGQEALEFVGADKSFEVAVVDSRCLGDMPLIDFFKKLQSLCSDMGLIHLTKARSSNETVKKVRALDAWEIYKPWILTELYWFIYGLIETRKEELANRSRS